MKKIVLIIVMTVGFTLAHCQSLDLTVVATAGDYFQGTNTSLSWTLGEPVIETFSNSGNILTQGFQQSKYIINNIYENPANDFIINIYPNPANDIINIDFTAKTTSLYAEVYDLLGKQVIRKELVELHEYLDMTNLVASEYLLTISSKEGKIIKTYKILKVE
jgi:hypothetical protein